MSRQPGMRKILHLRSSSQCVGLERLLLDLAPPMRQAGFDLHFVAFHRRARSEAAVHPFVEEGRRRGIDVAQMDGSPRVPLGALFQVASRLRREDFALLHTHDYKTDVLGLIAARLARVPCVATVHGYVPVSRRVRFYRRLDLLALRGFSRVLAVSGGLRDEVVAAGVDAARTAVGYNAVDAAAFTRLAPGSREAARRSLGLAPDRPLVATIARLIPGKGHRVLLDAAGQVRDVLPGTTFLVVGDGPLRETLVARAAGLGLGESVAFYGHRADVAAFMQAADVLVLPSLEEGMPMVLLEAMAVGCPVVASRVGGVPEIVEHGRSGLLVPPADAGRLAQAVLTVLQDRALADRLAAAGHAHVRGGFTVDAAAARLASVYESVLSERRA